MRQLTPQQLAEECGGILPPDAVLLPAARPPKPPAAKMSTRRGGDRFGTLNTFADLALARLNGGDVKVWLILFRDTKAATGTARTGQADIARRAGLTVRGVQKIIARLEGQGLLRVVRRGRLNVGPSTYRVSPIGDDSAAA